MSNQWWPISARDCRRLRKQRVTWELAIAFPVLVYTFFCVYSLWFTQGGCNNINRDAQEWLYSLYYACLVMCFTCRFLLRRLIMSSNTYREHVSVSETVKGASCLHYFALSRTHFTYVLALAGLLLAALTDFFLTYSCTFSCCCCPCLHLVCSMFCLGLWYSYNIKVRVLINCNIWILICSLHDNDVASTDISANKWNILQ